MPIGALCKRYQIIQSCLDNDKNKIQKITAMKKFVLLLIFFTAYIHLSPSQSIEEIILLKVKIKNAGVKQTVVIANGGKSDDDVKIIHNYDKNGRILTSEVGYVSGYQIFSNEYIYDSKDNIIVIKDLPEHPGRQESSTIMTYDSDGRLLTERSDDGEISYEYVYENGRLILKESVGLLEGIDTKYIYNGGILTGTKSGCGEGGYEYSQTYKYDERNNLTEIVYLSKKCNELEYTSDRTDLMFYNDKNLLVKVVEKSSSIEKIIEEYIYEYY